ncbi:hypothetical protein C5167_009080 [Papaver somniferum]|uniref:Uncharacterized protein n=1 Tax=Papaver somniferum TaxID=3469 RepID=A0A4Y7JXG0_PAPSO|nr:uncharacterized protein LOC113285681 [Papaver somniferum]RZC65387.1 hypothetical protein C5167_009080 [Papaver somniferum]
MGRDVNWGTGVAPTSGVVGGGGTPPLFIQREEHWRHFDNSVNAVSFGFVATAILISMFLIMAIFERFLRPRSTPLSNSSEAVAGGSRNINHRDLDHQSQIGFNGKLGFPSPKMSIYSRGVSVLMPGDKIPTYIAHPVPIPCPPERVFWPHHQQKPTSGSSSSSSPPANVT